MQSVNPDTCLFWQVNVIVLVVTMFKMVKHSTSMKPDSSRLGGIRWGVSLWEISLPHCGCLLWVCVRRVFVCVLLCVFVSEGRGWGDQFCVKRKIICTITAFASFLNFQKLHLTSLFIWFSLLLNPTRPIFLSFRFYFRPYRCCLFSSFYDSSMCTTQCDIAFFFISS